LLGAQYTCSSLSADVQHINEIFELMSVPYGDHKMKGLLQFSSRECDRISSYMPVPYELKLVVIIE